MYTKEIYVGSQALQIDKQRWVSSSPPSGPLYWNRDFNRIEVVEVGQYGANKHELPSETAIVEISPDTAEILAWARRKMQEEQELAVLCQANPALADLRDKFMTTAALVRQQ